jgi:Ca2+-binding RTX toxin-like protein
LLVGGSGNDSYSVDSTGDVVVEDPGDGIDTVRSTVTFTLAAAIENLTLLNGSNINGTGNALGNIITGNGGNNVITGLGGGDTMDGGGGLDTLSYAGSSVGVGVSLATGDASGGDALGDVFANFEKLTGSSFNDTLEGDGNANTLAGGSGTDMLSYAHASGGVTVALSITGAQNTGGAGIDTVSQFENLTGSNFADVLAGNSSNNSISGGNGSDSLDGGGVTARTRSTAAPAPTRWPAEITRIFMSWTMRAMSSSNRQLAAPRIA